MALCLYCLVLARTAWMADDAYISLRVVDNFVHGYGLRWNVGERVQAYTSPLWVLFLSAGYFVTREAYFTTLLLSFVVSLGAVLLVSLRAAASKTGAILALGTLITSRAFVDYSTSGLENPLTHLLVAYFAYRLLKAKEYDARLLLHLSLVTSAAMLNRMDTVLLLAPALLIVAWRLSWRAALQPMLLGSIPIVLWTAFSIVYYGFPVPNTAYAKLGGGVPFGERIAQGLTYLLDSLIVDPVTLLVIGWAACLAFRARSIRSIALAAGMILYLAYAVRIGGDFMSGRFFSAPLLLAAILVSRSPAFRHGPAAAVALALVLAVGWAGRTPNLLSGVEAAGYDKLEIPETGIADERRYYYQRTGLLFFQRWEEVPLVASPKRQRKWRDPTTDTRVYTAGAIGFAGYFAGPDTHIVDPLGLSDPLLARLPAEYDPGWRIGHLKRAVPAGYVESIESGENRLHDPELAAYFDKLKLITTGDLFCADRWKAIWTMNLAQDRHLIDQDKYRFDGLVELTQAELLPSEGCHERFVVPETGYRVRLDELHHDSTLRVKMSSTAKFRFLMVKDDEVLGSQDLYLFGRTKRVSYGMLWIPDDVCESGFDELRIYRLPGGNRYFLEELELGE